MVSSALKYIDDKNKEILIEELKAIIDELDALIISLEK